MVAIVPPPTNTSAAATPEMNRAADSTTKFPVVARDRKRRRPMPRSTPAPEQTVRLPANAHQRAGEIAGRIRRVHEPGRRIRPVQAVAHIRQQQRIGETAMPRPTVGASDRIRIRRAGSAGCASVRSSRVKNCRPRHCGSECSNRQQRRMATLSRQGGTAL